MRIHTAVTLYVLVFSPFFALDKIEYAILLIIIAIVLSAEMVNTSVEELTNLSSSSYNPLAKVAKDIAAGAVLLASAFSVVIGIILFLKPWAFVNIFEFMFSQVWRFILFVVITVIVLIYIVLGPKGIREKFRLNSSKILNR
jgi:diacylglycerol kinase (ATP)